MAKKKKVPTNPEALSNVNYEVEEREHRTDGFVFFIRAGSD